MPLSADAKQDLRAHAERALRDVLEDAENTDAAIQAAMGRLDWDQVGCRVLRDVLDEENTDAVLGAIFPKLQELVDKVTPGFISWIPFVDLAGRLRDALDDMLPDLLRDPLLSLVCGDK